MGWVARRCRCLAWDTNPWASLRLGPDLEGSRTVASSTPVRISVPDRGPRASRHLDPCGDEGTAAVMNEPEEILDADHEQLIERVAAIDVAKESGKVCVRRPDPARPGRRISRVWDVAATTNAVLLLACQLLELGVQKITVESTSDYWRIWFYLLESQGLDVQLVNARDVKNVPGRPKTDKLDAVWLAKLTEKGLLRPSFVPPTPIRALRDYTRMRMGAALDGVVASSRKRWYPACLWHTEQVRSHTALWVSCLCGLVAIRTRGYG